MDGPDFDQERVEGTFRWLEPVNRFLGGHQPVLAFFGREGRAWSRERTYELLDVGCGAADVPRALVRWARRAGYRLRVTAIDKHRLTVEWARRRSRGYPEISLRCADLFDLQEGGYDYVHAGQFLHHFSDEEVPAVLRQLLSLARRKLIVNDLLRLPLAYAGTWLFTLITSPVFRHDARISVQRGFTRSELQGTLSRCGLGRYRLRSHFFYRFTLVIDPRSKSGC